MEKYEENLDKASKALGIADHMAYVTFPLIRENKLLLRILTEIHTCLINLISAILQYENYYKRINLYKNADDNFETFKEVSVSYGISLDQINRILEIFRLVERHRKSPFEFVKNDKIVIMSEGMKTDTLTLEKIKFFLFETKDLLRKAQNVIKKRI